MERNLALELVRVTEAAALASARWMGKGDGAAAVGAAREAVAVVMSSIRMNGRVAIGSVQAPAGKKTRKTVKSDGPEIDVAIDALQAIESVALGRPYAISTIAVSNPDSFLVPPVPYMNKIAVGPDASGSIDIRASALDNLVNIAEAKRCYVEDLTVCILDRERHQVLIDDVRAAGARILLVSDGDLTAMLATAVPASGVDVVMGIGGSAEGVLAAAALRCVGGDIQAQFYPRDDAESKQLRDAGFASNDRVLKTEDLVRGENTMFAATGVTNSDVLQGVQFVPGGAVTHSLVMRSKSGTVRQITAQHRFDRKPVYK
jgi:fructose-1,6-bisphosphatase II